MPRRNAASGQQTYYCNGFSRDLALALHPQIVGVMGGPDGGVRQRRFAVVRHTEMPAVLLEIAFINHDDDALKLADADYHRAVGEAIRDGVIRYYGG
jgi:N-acetylmuramoyl-L-alanine amidase